MTFLRSLINRLPPVLVYVVKKSNKAETSIKLRVYMNHLRQNFITNMNIAIDCDGVTPFVVFNSIDEENQSRRVHRPIIANIISYQQSSSLRLSKNKFDTAENNLSSLSAASLSMRQNLSRSNQTLQQLREANADLRHTPESQLSYKRMSPNGPPLPNDLLGSLTRSGKID